MVQKEDPNTEKKVPLYFVLISEVAFPMYEVTPKYEAAYDIG